MDHLQVLRSRESRGVRRWLVPLAFLNLRLLMWKALTEGNAGKIYQVLATAWRANFWQTWMLPVFPEVKRL